MSMPRLPLQRLLLPALFCLLGVRAEAQCVTINLPDTVNACKNSQVNLSATVSNPSSLAILDTLWTPSAGLSDNSVANPTATVGTTGVNYTLSVRAITAANTVNNGDFSGGSSGFTSDYIPGTGGSWGLLSNEGQYAVTTSPNLVHTNFAAFADHTGGGGQMLVVNGSATANMSIWCQTIAVTPNTDYDFSTWAASCVASNPAILQFSINNVLIGSPFALSSTTGLWQQFHAVWNSGSNTTATICITNQNTAPSGNDFAIDDIEFKGICIESKSVFVKVSNMQYDITNSDVPCVDGKVNYQATDLGSNVTPIAFQWNYGDTQIGYGAGGDHVYASQGHYYVTLNYEDAYGCKDSTFKIVPVYNFSAPITITKDTAICHGASLLLSTSAGDNYTWSPAVGLSNATAQSTLATPDQTTTYQVQVTINGCVYNADVTVSVNPLPNVRIDDPGGAVTCYLPSIQLNAHGATTYEWFPANLCSDPLKATTTVVPGKTMYFTVVGTDDNKCVAHDSVMVEVRAETNVFVPTAFTPNGDGKNDILKPISDCGLRVQYFELHNRWGEKIFQSYNEKDGWDGSYKGAPSEMGSYFYYLRAETYDGKQVMRTGETTLIR